MWRLIVSFLIFLAALSALVNAKPMMAPSDGEAAKSDWIVEAEYLGYEKAVLKPAASNDPDQLPFIIGFQKSNDFEYFKGPFAQYKVTQILKESPDKAKITIGATIHVSYQFQDGSACLAPPDWKFSEKMMPQKGSRWILFLTPLDAHYGSGNFGTYRGDYGRWPATTQNSSKVKKLLAH